MCTAGHNFSSLCFLLVLRKQKIMIRSEREQTSLRTSILYMYFSEKKVHSKYTSFVLPEKEYIWSIFGKCTSFILQIPKDTLSILFQTSVLVKNSFSKKCSLSILWNRKKHSEDLEGLSESWNHFEKSVLKVWFKYNLTSKHHSDQFNVVLLKTQLRSCKHFFRVVKYIVGF